jgi:hypothetical protein
MIFKDDFIEILIYYNTTMKLLLFKHIKYIIQIYLKLFTFNHLFNIF